MIFYCLAQHHVVEHLEAERLVSTDRQISVPMDKAESSGAEKIPAIRILHPPRTLPQGEHRLKGTEHHALTKTIHDQAWKEHKVIGAGLFCISNRPAH